MIRVRVIPVQSVEEFFAQNNVNFEEQVKHISFNADICYLVYEE